MFPIPSYYFNYINKTKQKQYFAVELSCPHTIKYLFTFAADIPVKGDK